MELAEVHNLPRMDRKDGFVGFWLGMLLAFGDQLR